MTHIKESDLNPKVLEKCVAAMAQACAEAKLHQRELLEQITLDVLNVDVK